MKKSDEIKKIPNILKGYILTWVHQDLEADEICIYGDPQGLKSLGKALIAIANLNQKNLPDSELPPDDSFHKHYYTQIKVNNTGEWNLKNLRVGRVEEKKSGKLRSCLPSKK